MPPEMIALGVGIPLVCAAHLQDLPQNSRIRRRGLTQLDPIRSPPPIDDIVDGRGRKRFVVKVPVLHTWHYMVFPDPRQADSCVVHGQAPGTVPRGARS